MSFDYIFDMAYLTFARSESRSIYLSILDPESSREPKIWSDMSHSESSKIIEGGWHYTVPSGDYVKLAASGNAASGYMFYKVMTEYR